MDGNSIYARRVNSWQEGAIGVSSMSYQSIIFCQQDSNASVDLADGERDEHVCVRIVPAGEMCRCLEIHFVNLIGSFLPLAN